MIAENNRYYVYAHSLSKETNINSVFYIGKGNGNRSKSIKSRNQYWVNKVFKNNGFYIHYIKNNLYENEAFEIEKLYISILGKYQDNGLLVNMTDGGEGICGHKHSLETRQKISKSHLGKKVSEERKEKYKIMFSGKLNPRYNANVLISTRQKISKANKGKLEYEKHPKWKGNVLQLDINNNLINKFKTSSEVEKILGYSQSGIRNVINGNRKTAYGFKWIREIM